ncbi:hypothetical protein COCNU_scaffold008462G000040 [Cocos nucifera]|nr:hypothetical protein [Cocos nucifera]
MGRLPAALLILFFILSFCISPSIGGDTLTPTQSLTDGQELISAGERFVLGFFSPIQTNNRYIGIWYKISPSTVVWVANRQHPISEHNSRLSITANGTLIITNQNSKTIRSSSSSGLANLVARLLDDGNFFVKEANARAVPLASHRNNECKEGKDWELPLFDLGTIIAATNNFSIENKLGQGGFGPVYKVFS